MAHHSDGTADNPINLDYWWRRPRRTHIIDLTNDLDDSYDSFRGDRLSPISNSTPNQFPPPDLEIVGERPVRQAANAAIPREEHRPSYGHRIPIAVADTAARTSELRIPNRPPTRSSSDRGFSSKSSVRSPEQDEETTAKAIHVLQSSYQNDESCEQTQNPLSNPESEHADQSTLAKANSRSLSEESDHEGEVLHVQNTVPSARLEDRRSRDTSAPRRITRTLLRLEVQSSALEKTLNRVSDETDMAQESFTDSSDSQADALTQRINRRISQRDHPHELDQDAYRRARSAMTQHLIDFHEVHAYNVQNYLRVARTYLDRDILAKRKAGTFDSSFVPSIAENTLQVMDPFADTRPPEPSAIVCRVDFTVIRHDGKGEWSRKPDLRTPPTSYASTTADVPRFHEYVHLKRSLLTENNDKLPSIPFFHDDQHAEGDTLYPLWEDLGKVYKMKNQRLPFPTLRNEQYWMLKPYLKRFLEEVDVTWDNILFWFLAQTVDVEQIDPVWTQSAEFRSLRQGRESGADGYEQEDHESGYPFSRDSIKWQTFFADLEHLSPRNLRLSAIACDEFFKHCNYSLWHFARRSESAQARIANLAQRPTHLVTAAKFSYHDRLCRLCHEHDCPFHGEIREDISTNSQDDVFRHARIELNEDVNKSNSESNANDLARDSENTGKQGIEEDPDIEPIINYRRMVNVSHKKAFQEHPTISDNETQSIFHTTKAKPQEDVQADQALVPDYHDFRPFYPCNHQGSCEPGRCRCASEGRPCEKTCKCSSQCKIRFRGCGCSQSNKKGRLCTTDTCICFKSRRECDEDLCGRCGAANVLDPVNRYDEDIYKDDCANVSLQKGLPKKTLLGISELHGFGLYIAENVKKDEFIAEYKGEILSGGEMARRNTIYDYMDTNYTFKLNKEQDIDSARAGNKTRFLNHAAGRLANLYVQVKYCNSEIRIGFYAAKNLKAGTELYFDYGPEYTESVALTKNFRVPKVKKRALKTRTSKQRESFPQNARIPVHVERALRRNSDVDPGQSERHSTRMTTSSARSHDSQLTIPETEIEDVDELDISEEEDEYEDSVGSDSPEEQEAPSRAIMGLRSRPSGDLNEPEKPRRQGRKSQNQSILIRSRNITDPHSRSIGAGKRKRLIQDDEEDNDS